MTIRNTKTDSLTDLGWLKHRRAGIVNLLSVPGIQNMVPLPQTPEQLMVVVRDKPLEFEPGTKYQYSNSGYNLLGWLVEKVTGQRYQDFMDKNISCPSG